jgi:hypothetical protein
MPRALAISTSFMDARKSKSEATTIRLVNYNLKHFFRSDNLFDKETLSILKRCIAFSREPGQPKFHVQDIISENADAVWDIVKKQEGSVFVCGMVSYGNRHSLMQ